MRDHTLLQAIARVNRPYENEAEEMVKPHGFVLDFVGIFDKLEKALAFDSDEVNAIVKDLRLLKQLFAVKMKEQAPIEVESRFIEARMIYRSRDGLAVESKSEMAIASELEFARIPFGYNQKLEALGEVRYPDFVITHPKKGKLYYWEHCGRMDLENYRQRWARKKAWYAQQGHTVWHESENPTGTLIETIEDDDRHFSQESVKEIIRKLFL